MKKTINELRKRTASEFRKPLLIFSLSQLDYSVKLAIVYKGSIHLVMTNSKIPLRITLTISVIKSLFCDIKIIIKRSHLLLFSIYHFVHQHVIRIWLFALGDVIHRYLIVAR
jgi:hypothetical protein